MKVILSRKGFDSGYGGWPSPVLPDGTMLSLPIPVTDQAIKYSDLVYNGVKYSDIIRDLMGETIKVEGEGRFGLDDITCHLDPDIRKDVFVRKDGWKGIFGQNGAPFTHLSNQKVGKGDLFLYFGWFRKTIYDGAKLKYDPQCKGFHAIYGYLQVNQIKNIRDNDFEEWALYHPHVRRGKEASKFDHLYYASDQLTFLESKKGFGVFEFSDRVILTKDGRAKSRWELPTFFKRYKISYHTENSWKDDYFQSAAKGQEFVVHADDEIVKWVTSLF